MNNSQQSEVVPSNQRVCTCHPTDRPPICQHRYAATECQDAYRAYKVTRVTVSCLCGTQGCNAEVCNPTTFKLAIASVEIRDLREALAGRNADETTERCPMYWNVHAARCLRTKDHEGECWFAAPASALPTDKAFGAMPSEEPTPEHCSATTGEVGCVLKAGHPGPHQFRQIFSEKADEPTPKPARQWRGVVTHDPTECPACDEELRQIEQRAPEKATEPIRPHWCGDPACSDK